MKKTKTLTILAVAIFAFMATSVPAHAATGNAGDGFFSSIAAKVAQTFGLEQAKVEEVMKTQRQAHRGQAREEMHEKMNENLNKLVEDGKLTEAQKTAILEKFEQKKSEHKSENFKDLSGDERSEKRDAKKAEMEEWAQSQGIDPEILESLHPRGFRGNHFRK